MSDDKSVLDGRPVVEKGFPLQQGVLSRDGGSTPGRLLAIVGHCPDCGAPIYGDKDVPSGVSGVPEVKYSCTCHKAEKAEATLDLAKKYTK